MTRRILLQLFLSFAIFGGLLGCSKSEKTVLLAILARDKAHCLPHYLECIGALEYPKNAMTVYINTNNNSDETESLLKSWADKNRSLYKKIIFDSHTVEEYEQSGPHVWTQKMFKILGRIRNRSLQVAREEGCDFYFVVDCDNFIEPYTLRELISKDKPIVAPLLRSIPSASDPYSNYFCAVDPYGYYQNHPDYFPILMRSMEGTFEVPVVHCTYLIKAEHLGQLTYVDESSDYEFVIFSRSAREKGISQFICNEQDFGYLLHFQKEEVTVDEERKAVEDFVADRSVAF